MRRCVAALALSVALLGGGATGAGAQTAADPPGQPRSEPVTVTRDDGPPLGTMLAAFAGITAVWLVLTALVMRRQRRRRPIGLLDARPRRRLATEAGAFVPLSRVAAPVRERDPPEAEPKPEPEPEPDPEPQPQPAGPIVIHDRRPVAEPVPEQLPVPVRGELADARTYEIVWYRDEARLQFALQPVDGRSAPWARLRSDAFAWAEDCDPPAHLRGAQRAHGRLRARLAREGWRAAGRGDGWFSHRFHPPETPPE